MGNIIILDEKTANQIAAGEVIERPASVVKELAENAIDAGATAITVEIRNGGISYIRVTDNGCGMESDDVEIAFERHATSKIRKIEDLDSLSTMGFRGEALASIAAVSRMELRTKTASAQMGTLVRIEGGKILSVSQTGCPTGTTFIVSDLFYNTPARYKFLKKDSTEAGYVSAMMIRLALAHPEIAFKFINNHQVQHHTPGNHDLQSAIYSLFGGDTAKMLLELDYEESGYKVSGYVGKPEIARGNRNSQYFFINGRTTKNKVLTAAVEDAYKTLLMQNKFPFCVLNLRLSPDMYDVNVHPQKLEVRFSNENAVYLAVFHGVKNALSSASLIREVTGSSYEAHRHVPVPKDHVQVELDTRSHPATKIPPNQRFPLPWEPAAHANGGPAGSGKLSDELSEEPGMAHGSQEAESHAAQAMTAGHGADGFNIGTSRSWPDLKSGTSSPEERGRKPESGNPGPEENIAGMSAGGMESQPLTAASGAPDNLRSHVAVSASETNGYTAGSPAPEADRPAAGQAETREMFPEEEGRGSDVLLEAEIVGQVFDTYIILQHGDRMYLIDQHAAHERIRYEQLKKRISEGQACSQLVLEPFIVRLSPAEYDYLFSRMEDFERAGFEIEAFGPQTVIIRSVPDILEDGFSLDDFHEILDRWMSTMGEKNGISDEALYMMACKSAIKANRKLEREEIQALVQQLCSMENPYTCVHGRPVVISISKRELEKRFKRIV